MKRSNESACKAGCTSVRCPARPYCTNAYDLETIGGRYGLTLPPKLNDDNELLKQVCSGETVKHTPTKYIPEEIINECAYEAYRATYNHYERTTRSDISVWDTDLRLQKRVVKDVKAVLYGNRTPSQLHEAWAARKLHACGYDLLKLREIAPTAEKAFYTLPKDDQRGYEVFVETVKATYKKLAYGGKAKEEKKETASSKPVGVKLYLNAYSSANELVGETLSSDPFVIVKFRTFKEAQDFYKELAGSILRQVF